MDRLPASELHDHVRLREPVPPALRRRRPDPRQEIRPRERLWAPRGGHLGAGLRRDPARAVERHRGEVHHRHDPADDQWHLGIRPGVLAQRRRRARHHDRAHGRHGPGPLGLPGPGGGRVGPRAEPPERDGHRQGAGDDLERSGRIGRSRP